MSVHVDVWIRELSRAGLSPSAQQELLARLAPIIDCRARYFPGATRARMIAARPIPFVIGDCTAPWNPAITQQRRILTSMVLFRPGGIGLRLSAR